MRELSEVQLGRQVKDARERQWLSLRALAARSGVSINAISRIERGETSPTVVSLRRLAAALGQPIGAFFSDGPAPASMVVRRDRRLRSEGEGIVLESLAFGLPDQRFEPYMLTLEPGPAVSPPQSRTADRNSCCACRGACCAWWGRKPTLWPPATACSSWPLGLTYAATTAQDLPRCSWCTNACPRIAALTWNSERRKEMQPCSSAIE
jgi:transcriptional regulator with XRE-family HTH domain